MSDSTRTLPWHDDELADGKYGYVSHVTNSGERYVYEVWCYCGIAVKVAPGGSTPGFLQLETGRVIRAPRRVR